MIDGPLLERVHTLRALTKIAPVRSNRQLEEVQRLRHRCYVREGAIAARPSARLDDEYDASPNGVVFGVSIDDEIVASVRVHVLRSVSDRSPTRLSFDDYITPMLVEGKVAVDPNRFVVDFEASRRWSALPYLVLSLPYQVAVAVSADIALAAVRQEHMPFYSRTLRYVAVASPRPYLQLTKPLGLMTADFKREHASVIKRFPFFDPDPAGLQQFIESDAFTTLGAASQG